MAVQRFKLAINNADIPLVSTKASRAVSVPSLDSANRTPRGFYGHESSRDSNLAQVIYCENVLPVAEGVRSVSYEELVAASANNDFNSIITLRGEDESTVLFSPASNKNYIYDSDAGAWTTTPLEDTIAPRSFHADSDPVTSTVTYAYVDGYTFVCYSRLKSRVDLYDPVEADLSIYYWDTALQELNDGAYLVKNLPFPPGEVDGISSSSGFLIVWSGLEVAWARYGGVGIEFDFSISLTSSSLAGRQIPEDIKGPITAVVDLPGGFVIFTTRNAIAANYFAQSTISPWVFREIPNAGGVASYEQITVDSSLGSLVAYTSAGMQRISLNSAETQYPEVGDFFTSRTVERYDFGSHALLQGGVNTNMAVKVTAIGRRYIVISYGYFANIYSYALVFDLALQRWGKLRVVHTDCFHYSQKLPPAAVTYAAMIDVSYSDTAPLTYEDMYSEDTGITQAQNAMAFLRRNGQILGAAWQSSSRNEEDAAVVVLGRIQLSRSRRTQFNRTEIEGLQEGKVYIQASDNGRTLLPAEELVIIEQTGDFMAAGALVDCLNFNLAVEGRFNLSTVIVEAALTGKV